MTHRTAQTFALGPTLTLTATRLIAIAALITVETVQAAPVRSQAQDTAVSRLTFDVASVKPNNDKVYAATRVTPTGISYTAVTVKALIADAYGVKALSMAGVNANANGVLDDSERYDVDAKAGHAVSRAELQVMMRTLLADRFKLSLHHDSKVEPIYKLTALPDGSKLQESVGDGSAACETAPDGGAVCHGMTMAAFSDYLSSHLNRVVVDETKLTTRYDFALKLKGTPGTNQLRESFGGGADPGAAKLAWVAAMNDWTASSIFTDIQRQLGLKLDADKAPVDHLVIDHLERPAPDSPMPIAPFSRPSAKLRATLISSMGRGFGVAGSALRAHR